MLCLGMYMQYVFILGVDILTCNSRKGAINNTIDGSDLIIK